MLVLDGAEGPISDIEGTGHDPVREGNPNVRGRDCSSVVDRLPDHPISALNWIILST